MMSDLKQSGPRRSRATGIRKSDISRVIRAALEAGMEVREIVATRDGVRILSSPGTASTANSWDEVLGDG